MTSPDAIAAYQNPPVDTGAVPRRVGVLDTDPGVRWVLEKGLQRSGYDLSVGSTVAELMQEAQDNPFDVIVLELLEEAGVTAEALSMLTGTEAATHVICVSVDSSPQTVIDCMRRGAADFIPKPYGLDEIRRAIERVLATGGSRRQSARQATGGAAPQDAGQSFLVGISPAMQELRTLIKQVAETDLNCLIRGESGTGKDMVAREIHRLSRRSDRPFVKVNCTALPDQLLESELFGYEKGAFTGAVTSKPGRFQLANHGTIFLDEIGDLQPSLQAKLLQVLEHKEFTKLGGTKPIKVDVQIIAATNVDLDERIRQHLFRDDLYFRMNEVSIWVAPLSERREDIALLVRHFVKKHGRYNADPNFAITGEDIARLSEEPWDGNVRELESTIKRWLALGAKVIPGQAPPAQPPPKADDKEEASGKPEENLPEPERIRQALEANQWNRRKASEALGISYQTLRRRITKYGLDQRRG